MKRLISLTLASIMAFSFLAGCTEKEEIKEDETTKGEQVEVDPNKPYAGTVLKYATTDTAAQGDEIQDLVAMVKEETGIVLEFTIIPATKTGEVNKTLVSLQAGDEIDIIYETNQGLKNYYDAGVLSPINELAEKAGYDFNAVFGENVPVFSDDKAYGLPAFNDIWLTFYNKKVFDEAGVAYPNPEGWTWEKYVETAQQLTDVDKNIFGSLMLDYDIYNTMLALQKGATHYGEDGLTNYDDVLFKESVEFYYSLGNDLKIQPDLLSYSAGIYPWNSFVSTGVANEDGTYDNAQFGMFICGGWVTSMFTNVEKYPRDWQAGLAPFPYPEGYEPSTFSVNGSYAIPSTSENKEAAFEAVKCMAENQYTLGYGRVPSRVDLTDVEITEYIEANMVPTYAETDGITAEMFEDAWFDNERKILSEKIVGTADTTLSRIWVEEAQLYGLGEKSIEETMDKILERSNKAITDALN